METKDKEIKLIKAFKRGDIKAFEELFEKYHRQLYAFLFHLFHSKEDAEEIVQEAFIKIWEKREDFNERYSFNSFLFTIAKNAFLNLNRKKVNQKIVDHPDVIPLVSCEKTDDYIIFKETKELIDSIINDLPPKRKEIFLLRKDKELTRTEIALKLNISVSTVDNQLTKANSYLKEQFKKHSLLFLIFLFC